MSTINVISRTQRIVIDPASRSVAVINLGPQGPVGDPAHYIKSDGSIAMTGDLVLPGDPDSALEAAPKQYVDKRYRFQGSRASVSYGATTDTAVGAITTVENLNDGYTVSTGTITFLQAGTYLISASLGGNSQAAGSAIQMQFTGSRIHTIPCVPSTTWPTTLTVMETVAANDTVSFTYRNGGAAVSLAFTVEIIKV